MVNKKKSWWENLSAKEMALRFIDEQQPRPVQVSSSFDTSPATEHKPKEEEEKKEEKPKQEEKKPEEKKPEEEKEKAQEKKQEVSIHEDTKQEPQPQPQPQPHEEDEERKEEEITDQKLTKEKEEEPAKKEEEPAKKEEEPAKKEEEPAKKEEEPAEESEESEESEDSDEEKEELSFLYFRVSFSFQAETEGELSAKKGEIVRVTEKALRCVGVYVWLVVSSS